MHGLGKIGSVDQKEIKIFVKKLKRKFNRTENSDILKPVSTEAVCIESDFSEE